MSFLQKAREKASEVAREAADATSKVGGAAAAKAQDPATQEMVRSGLAVAGRTTGAVARDAADVTSRAAGAAVAKAQDPTTQARVRDGLASAGRGARTMVERIDPGILADVVIKATGLQEKANARLREKGSMYRIAEIVVSASLPPGVSFSIARIGDVEDEPPTAVRSSTEILAQEGADEARMAETEGILPGIVSLDGEQQAAIAIEVETATSEPDAEAEVASGLPGEADGSYPE